MKVSLPRNYKKKKKIVSKLFRCDVYFTTCNSNTILISFPVHVHKYTHHWNSLISAKYYNDVIMGAMPSQITSLTIVYSTIYSGGDQRKHQSSVSLAFVRGITGEFPAQMASNAQNISIRWRHYEYRIYNELSTGTNQMVTTLHTFQMISMREKVFILIEISLKPASKRSADNMS